MSEDEKELTILQLELDPKEEQRTIRRIEQGEMEVPEETPEPD